MTVKQVAEQFRISETIIRKCIKDGMVIKAIKQSNGRYDIPDKTEIIMTKSQMRSFLWLIYQYKNNSRTVISNEFWHDKHSLKILADYICALGYIGSNYIISDSDAYVKEFFNRVQVSPKGEDFLRGSFRFKNNANINVYFNFNFSPQVGLINTQI